jgi:hypothetical protein
MSSSYQQTSMLFNGCIMAMIGVPQNHSLKTHHHACHTGPNRSPSESPTLFILAPFPTSEPGDQRPELPSHYSSIRMHSKYLCHLRSHDSVPFANRIYLTVYIFATVTPSLSVMRSAALLHLPAPLLRGVHARLCISRRVKEKGT